MTVDPAREAGPPAPSGGRTFHARGGRLGPARRARLDEALVGLAPAELPRGAPAWRLCGRQAPTLVEIGCGRGEAALHFARAHLDWNVVALDVHRGGLAHLVAVLADLGDADRPPGLRVARADALVLLAGLEDRSVDVIRALFPDPWPKRKHHHRRLVQARHVALLVSKLRVGGRLEVATDHGDYAQQMRRVLDAEPHLSGGSVGRRDRPTTYYEARALAAGRSVTDLSYRRR
ncbi:MAG: tRNA (guanosine(46)-N7)-methyltransferase TrmB [Acidimicrobiia bacterium]|nr:tRNA (guanosine(46)-N7)-methyltransferase TrmB [Acidimicrobiia bacterium]